MIKTTNQELINENSSLIKLCAEKDSEIKKLKNRVSDLESEKKELQKEVSDLEDQVNQLENFETEEDANMSEIPDKLIPENLDHIQKLELLAEADIFNKYNYFQLKEKLEL